MLLQIVPFYLQELWDLIVDCWKCWSLHNMHSSENMRGWQLYDNASAALFRAVPGAGRTGRSYRAPLFAGVPRMYITMYEIFRAQRHLKLICKHPVLYIYIETLNTRILILKFIGYMFRYQVPSSVHLKTSTQLHIFIFPTPDHLQFDSNVYPHWSSLHKKI
jgi:hypothetical protein